MATITPTTAINATTMAANWGKGVAANAPKWLNKYLNPKALFNANPQQAQTAWAAGVQAALAANSYATGMQNANLTAAANNASQFGVTNYANSGTTKAYKYANKSVSLAAAETSVLATVNAMPKGRGANNQARMLAWSNGMAAYKGKITSSA
jgi:hypothetical protein